MFKVYTALKKINFNDIVDVFWKTKRGINGLEQKLRPLLQGSCTGSDKAHGLKTKVYRILLNVELLKVTQVL